MFLLIRAYAAFAAFAAGAAGGALLPFGFLSISAFALHHLGPMAGQFFRTLHLGGI